MNFALTWDVMLAAAAGITAIGAAAAVIKRALSPLTKALKRLEDVEDKLDSDYQRLNEAAEYDKAVAHALIALLNHAETGNSTGTVRAARDTLQHFLIEKG